MMNKTILFTLALSTFAYSTMSIAHHPQKQIDLTDDGSGFIIGAQVGYVETNWGDIDHNAFTNYALRVGKDTNVGVRPYVGYAINRFFALELGWTYLGNARIYNFNQLQPTDYTKLTTIKNSAYDVSINFNAPINDCYGVFGRLGVAYLISNHSLNWRTVPFVIPINQFPLQPNQIPTRRNSTNYNVTFGAGVYYNFTPKARMEIAWTRFEGNSSMDDSYQPNSNFFSLGASYRLNSL